MVCLMFQFALCFTCFSIGSLGSFLWHGMAAIDGSRHCCFSSSAFEVLKIRGLQSACKHAISGNLLALLFPAGTWASRYRGPLQFIHSFTSEPRRQKRAAETPRSSTAAVEKPPITSSSGRLQDLKRGKGSEKTPRLK